MSITTTNKIVKHFGRLCCSFSLYTIADNRPDEKESLRCLEMHANELLEAIEAERARIEEHEQQA